MYREEEVGGRKWSNGCRTHKKKKNIITIKNKKKEKKARRCKERSIKNQVMKQTEKNQQYRDEEK